MTVSYLINKTFRVKKGQTVLFHAAAGGVGLIACQWLSNIGVQVIGTVSSEDKVEIANDPPSEVNKAVDISGSFGS